MFAGIVECHARVLRCDLREAVLGLTIERPKDFNDIKLGDSIAVNGVCLTVEKFDSESMSFTLGQETLSITGWEPEFFTERNVNLERSLRWNDRIHGHLTSGHVDTTGTVTHIENVGENKTLTIKVPELFTPMIWKKGSVSLQGVSLTINEVNGDTFQVGLIPETLRRTNLNQLTLGERVNLEADQMARGIHRYLETRRGEKWL